jgi:hypothetical protein
MARLRTLLALIALPVALALPATASAASLSGSVGPGMTISMSKPSGPGTYTVTISDQSDIHNFHLTGPGVNRATDVPGQGTTSWTVNFQAGATYTYVCDVHPSMSGSFTVPAASGSTSPSGTGSTAAGAGVTPVAGATTAAGGALPQTGSPFTTPVALFGYFCIISGMVLVRTKRRRRPRYIELR